jgi:hypothetical protein
MDVVVSDGISLTTAPRPAQYFALGKLPYNTGKSSKTSDDFLSPSEAQKDIEYWRDNFMVGPKVAHTTNAIFGVLRKLKHDQRQEMTGAEVNSLLAIAEKGPTSRKIG